MLCLVRRREPARHGPRALVTSHQGAFTQFSNTLIQTAFRARASCRRRPSSPPTAEASSPGRPPSGPGVCRSRSSPTAPWAPVPGVRDDSSTRSAAAVTRTRASVIRASLGVLAPLEALQRAQHATRLLQLQPPPREMGVTWSSVVAALPQYWHALLSRMSTFRRVRLTLPPFNGLRKIDILSCRGEVSVA